MNYFMNGMWHPLLIPVHVLLIIGLALLLGQQGVRHSRMAIPLFILGAGMGLVLSLSFRPMPQMPLMLLIFSFVVASLTAVYWRLPVWLPSLLLLLAGLLLGIDSKPLILPGVASSKAYSSFAGTLLSTSTLLLVATLLATLLQRFWQGVLVRALSSWIIAASLMVLALVWTKHITL